MTSASSHRALSAQDLAPLLEVTRRLAEPFDLMSMLAEVIKAAKQVLDAERGAVWLYDKTANELVLQVATDIAPVRVPATTGLVGSCAQNRQLINVTDCYADPRFNADLDRQSNYRTRCMLTLPLIDHQNALVGVLQVLNKRDSVFDVDDEVLATSLAAQCAVAIQRVQMTNALIESEKMRQELEMARAVQKSTLPEVMPAFAGYEVYGESNPADLTGGDTFDVALVDDKLLLVLGDATGHGLAPALQVTQMQAMLRMAFRLGTPLDVAYMQLNNQLCLMLDDDKFITAFIGLLNPRDHTMRYHSGGQAPILHYRAADQTWHRRHPTCFPLAAMSIAAVRSAAELVLGAGDMLVLLSDGIFEYHNDAGEMFGEQRVMELVADCRDLPLSETAELLMDAVKRFANGAPQEDDITILLLKRASGNSANKKSFRRKIASLADIFAFTAAAAKDFSLTDEVLGAIDFTIEELFTNMVKYSTMSVADVDIELAAIPNGVEVVLVDHDVDLFDLTKAPDVDIHRPIAERQPGGLGLHLIRRLVNSIEYDYHAPTRTSRTTIRKTNISAS